MADLKTMTCCKTRYPPARFRNAVRQDAVRVRQAQITREYKKKARDMDRDYNDHTGNGQGPVEARLSTYGRIRGLICGAFGEGSPDMHTLCAKLVSAGAAARAQDLGAQSTKQAKIRASRYIYRMMGIEMMRGTAALKYYRLTIIISGPESAKAAAIRRQCAQRAWDNEHEDYFDRHSFGSRAHIRPW